MRLPLALLLALLVLPVGCGDDDDDATGAGGIGGSGGSGGGGGSPTAGGSGGGGGAPVCAPGKAEPCTCPGGAQSSQYCRTDGTGYDMCLCLTGEGGGAGAAGAGGGGTSGAGGATCIPGTFSACTCANGETGARPCEPDGTSSGPCSCGGTAGAAGGGGSTGGSSGAAGAAGTASACELACADADGQWPRCGEQSECSCAPTCEVGECAPWKIQGEFACTCRRDTGNDETCDFAYPGFGKAITCQESFELGGKCKHNPGSTLWCCQPLPSHLDAAPPHGATMARWPFLPNRPATGRLPTVTQDNRSLRHRRARTPKQPSSWAFSPSAAVGP